MNKQKTKPDYGIIFVTGYYILVIAAFSFAYFVITYQPGKSEFVGVYPVVVTLPWSLLLAPVLVFIKSTSLKMLILIICSIPTAIFLHKIGRRF